MVSLYVEALGPEADIDAFESCLVLAVMLTGSTCVYSSRRPCSTRALTRRETVGRDMSHVSLSSFADSRSVFVATRMSRAYSSSSVANTSGGLSPSVTFPEPS